MVGKLQPKVAFSQQPEVAYRTDRMQPMVATDNSGKDMARARFSAALAGVLDRIPEAAGRKRVGWLKAKMGVSGEGARKWLSGLAMPEATRWADLVAATGATYQELFGMAMPGDRFEEGSSEYDVDPSAAIERLKSDIQSLRQVIGLMATALAQNVPDAIERVALGLRRNNLPVERNFLHDFLEQVDNALALRREALGLRPGESIQTSGSARRP